MPYFESIENFQNILFKENVWTLFQNMNATGSDMVSVKNVHRYKI